MAGSSPEGAPIIIKKVKKVGGDGHHGGAWKVAYADFATAMMAFFLLMWLLNATTEAQRKGLADYFNPSIPISKVSGGGAGALNGSSMTSEETLANDGQGASRRFPSADKRAIKSHPDDDDEAARKAAAEAEKKRLQEIEEAINAQADQLLDPSLSRHLHTRMTPDGLVIELIDADREPLFNIGSSDPSGLLLDLLSVIGPVLAVVTNEMAVVGHTDARAFSNRKGYTNWELSSERALSARRLLINSGIPNEQIVEVTGKADTEPFSDDPFAPQNRRIAITLLTKDL